MKEYKLLFLFLIFFASGKVTCQEQQSPSIHSITFGIGVNWLKEENLFPIVHKGSNFGLTYKFEKKGNQFQEVLVTIKYGKIKAELEKEKVSQNEQFDLQYSMGFHLINSEKIDLYLGYNLRYAYSLVEFPVWDESRAYWGTSLTLGLSNRLIIDITENQKWYFSWDINPIGLYSRPDEVRLYAQEEWTFPNIVRITNSGIKPGFIYNVFLSYFRTEYRFITKKDRYFAFLYSLSYSRIQKTNEHPLLNSLNSLGISLGF